MNVIYSAQLSLKPILFTEGVTDPIIVRAAWEQLYDDEMPFVPFFAFSCTYLSQLITDPHIHTELAGHPIFALFDFDKAYDQWNGIKGSLLVDDPFLGLTKKWDGGNAYAFMLPVPRIEAIQQQVIKDSNTKTTFQGESRLQIEHYFYGEKGTESFFDEERCSGGGQRIVFKQTKKKIDFADEIVPTMPSSCFEPFRPIFEFIKSKIS